MLVTATSFGRAHPELRADLEAAVGEVVYNPYGRPLTEGELAEKLDGCDGMIAGLDVITGRALGEAARLKVIARYGSGVDRVDLEAATARGIVVTNTPGANANAVAELAVGLILALARHLIAGDRAVRRGEFPRLPGMGLSGKTIGLVGFGAIGRATAGRLKAFGCRILVYDPYVPEAEVAAAGAQVVPLEALLREADCVSLHARVTEETRGLVDRRFLALMRAGAVLVNTARGELIDEGALVEALECGRLGGAGLDCFVEEPLPPEHPLTRLPQVILTPHLGAQTDEAVEAMGRLALEACLAVLSGERPRYVVNPEVYERESPPRGGVKRD